MADDLKVLASEPLPELSVAKSEPLPATPSVGQRALKNLPGSLLNLAKTAAGMHVNFGPPPIKNADGSYSLAPIDPLGELTGMVSSVGHMIFNPSESFAEDPAGTVALPASLIYGGYRGLTSDTGKRVLSGAYKGATSGEALPWTPKQGASYGTGLGALIGGREGAEWGGGIGMGIPTVAGAIKGGVKELAKSRYGNLPKGPSPRWAGPSPTIIPPPDFVPTPATELPSGKIPGSITNQAPLDVSIPMRPSPRWAGIEPTITPPPDFVPTPATGLPSGRVPGSISSQSPLENIPKGPSPVEDVGRLDDLAKSLSGKKFSKLDDARKQAVIDIAERLKRQGKPSIPAPPGMQSPVDTSQVPVSNPPSAGAVPFKGHDAQMTDLIRQFHAQWPKGTSLRDISSDVFGTKGAVPNYEQALKIHEYMLKNNGKIPTAGDLK